jgi:hypothetical protein
MFRVPLELLKVRFEAHLKTIFRKEQFQLVEQITICLLKEPFTFNKMNEDAHVDPEG